MMSDSISGGVRQNIFYSLVDYVSQPGLMVLAAPTLLRHLGLEQYGVWMLVNSITATAYGLGGGFSEAATRYVSHYRGLGDGRGVARSMAAALLINCGLGLVLVLILLIAAPALIDHVFKVAPAFRYTVIVAVRISAAVLWLRVAEVVFVAAIRAFERYRPAVLVSVAARCLVVLFSLVLSYRGRGLVAILLATLAISVGSLIAQAVGAAAVVPRTRVALPDLVSGLREIVHFGVYTWMKSASGAVFGYADRLMIAGILGATPLAYYTLCSQVTQPIPAAAAAVFNFLFPMISSRRAAGKWTEASTIYQRASGVNAVAVCTLILLAGVAAKPGLSLWLGPDMAERCNLPFIVMMAAGGLLALGIVPQYAALALGRSRALALMNIASGFLTIGGGYLLIRRFGVLGGGFAKAVVAVVSLASFAIARSAFHECRPAPVSDRDKIVTCEELLPAE
jgi:O-antigen/teichoic acid export membrane protein